MIPALREEKGILSPFLSSAGGEQQKWSFQEWVLRGSSDTSALAVWLEAQEAGDSFAQVHRSGLGAQDSSDDDDGKLQK